MKQIAIRSLGMGTILVGLAGTLIQPGCALQAEGERETQSASDNDGISLVTPDDSVEKSISLTPPASFVSWAEIGTGTWGDWSTSFTTFCQPGSYAYTVQIRTEAPQGSDDDTAMNDIMLECFDKNTGSYTGTLVSVGGSAGSFTAIATSNPFTTANPFVGGRMKIEAPVGSGDDTAANQVALVAKNGLETQPQASSGWGSWNQPDAARAVRCPASTAVCGLWTRVESHLGQGHDDTALNGIRLACCTF